MPPPRLQPVAAPYRAAAQDPNPDQSTQATPALSPPTQGLQRRTAANSGSPAAQGAREQYHSVHVYGGRAALCFSADETRAGEHTVRIEAAPATAPKAYAWADKVALQLTTRELPQVLAVVAGLVPALKLSNHGEATDKSASFQNQAGGKLFVSVWQGKNARAVPIMPADVWPVFDLLLKQVLANSPHLTADAVLTGLRLVSQRYVAAQPSNTGE